MGEPRDEHLWKGEERSRRCRGRAQTKYRPNSSLAEARSHPRTRMVLLSFWSWAERDDRHLYSGTNHSLTVGHLRKGCDLRQGDSTAKSCLKGLTVKGCLPSMMALS